MHYSAHPGAPGMQRLRWPTSDALATKGSKGCQWRYGVPMAESSIDVIGVGLRGALTRYAVCLMLAHARRCERA